jgi:FMN-dependent NADH-azoreductase
MQNQSVTAKEREQYIKGYQSQNPDETIHIQGVSNIIPVLSEKMSNIQLRIAEMSVKNYGAYGVKIKGVKLLYILELTYQN